MSEFEALLETMATLRNKEVGCPWDIEQTHKSLAHHAIEEAYELQAAIFSENSTNLKEELGDLLLQVIFHSQIAKEESSFTIRDVIENIHAKLIRRHPYVFGKDDYPKTAEEQTALWNKIKNLEKTEEQARVSIDIRDNLPPLLKSVEIQRNATNKSFDWDRPDQIIDKIQEELDEIREAFKGGTQEKVAEEIGDTFFALINFCNKLNINPENVIAQANQKFLRRFGALERIIEAKNLDMSLLDLTALNELWEEAKNDLAD
ncbi:MAG: nucleoside triphosphate pyrophosphohydrolase [Gammaproteobacteria bacterium]